jgi:DNA-binding IclR family transcriptional regulator
MTRTHRVLDVLRMVSDDGAGLSALQIAERLGCARATAYRCIADLEQSGLIERSNEGCYVLGPTIVELDRQLRLSDPLVQAAQPVMRSLCERTGGAILLCRIHGHKVLCVHQCAGPQAPRSVSYERGRAMPLYRGATSRAILAHLDARRIETLVRVDAQGLLAAGFATTAAELTEQLAELRRKAVFRTEGELDADAIGWAVALYHGKQLLGSLSVVMGSEHKGDRDGTIADQLRRAGLRIEGILEGQRAPRRSVADAA